MAVKAPPRKLTHSSSKKHFFGHSIGVSTAFISTFLCMFLICFFFLDMKMIYLKAGVASPSPVVLQTQGYGLWHAASESLSELMNSTTVVASPAVEVKVDTDSETEEEAGVVNKLGEDAAPAQVDVEPSQVNMEPSQVDAEPSQVHAEPSQVHAEPSQVDTEPSQAGSIIAPEEILMPPEESEEVTVEDETAGPVSVEEGKIEMPREERSLVGCDITQGQWVYDNVSYPLYRTKNCPFVDPGFRCEENGRPDKEWMSYHWQPHDCDLPRFNATDILERLRGQRVVFVGDSLGRNNWESMLCMLAEGVTDKSKIYEVNGEPITKHSGKLVYRFVDFNCTVEYYRDPFLVPQTRPPRGSPANVTCVLRVDHVSWSIDKWWDADIIIFNAGHWWTEHKIFRQGCRFQEGNELKMKYDVPTGLAKALQTWATWLEKHLDPKKSQVFWLSFPTVHFRGGTWNRGGHCHQEHRPLTEEEVRAEWQTPWMNQIVLDEFMSRIKKKLDAVTYLDITTATNYRSDGHGALYTWDTKKYGLKPRNRQDCSHFCLPGVPDAWNELILASLFAKGKGTWAQPVRL